MDETEKGEINIPLLEALEEEVKVISARANLQKLQEERDFALRQFVYGN